MKTQYKNIWIGLAVLIAFWGCKRTMTDYRSFLNNQEITYPGKVVSPSVLPGNLRLELTWSPSPDPSVAKYVVYWNNNLDSTVVPAKLHLSTDTVRCLISNLSEYTYTFFIYSYDSAGNRSVPTEIDNARVYGPVYRTNLFNRSQDKSNISIVNPDGTVSLNFLAPVDTINITTAVRYVAAAGDSVLVNLAPDSNALTLPNYKAGTRITYQSSYIPQTRAIDTFLTNTPDTVSLYVMCDKTLFNAVHSPYDLNPYDGNTYEARLWDGSMEPRGYPTIFHSDGSTSLPGTLTMDMGKVYNDVARVEETGRNCCHNPSDFEIWGIADTTGAVSALAPTDPGWKADVTAKGWTLMQEVVRSDDGVAPLDVLLTGKTSPARFIIIRVLATVDNSNYVNMSQITFWNKQ